MKNEILTSIARLTDDDLVATLKTLIGREREATALVVAHLAELETRDVWLREGYGSLYLYCRDALGLSEWESYNRIEVARAARSFPLILDLLEAGSVHLSTVRLVVPHLTPENHRDLLESIRGKTKREVQEIAASLQPQPDVPTSIRRVSTPSAEGDAPASLLLCAPTDVLPLSVATAHGPAVPTLAAAPAAVIAPLSPDRYKLQVTIGGDTLEKLRCAQDMLGHAIPSGDAAAVLDRALGALLVELAKTKFGGTTRPRQSRKAGVRGEPSAAVKRAVWIRDRGRCAFIGSGGHRCDERRFVEFHHLDPECLGGEATPEKMELRCRRHNDYEGRLWFGKRGRANGLVPEQVRLTS